MCRRLCRNTLESQNNAAESLKTSPTSHLHHHFKQSYDAKYKKLKYLNVQASGTYRYPSPPLAPASICYPPPFCSCGCPSDNEGHSCDAQAKLPFIKQNDDITEDHQIMYWTISGKFIIYIKQDMSLYFSPSRTMIIDATVAPSIIDAKVQIGGIATI